MATQDRNPTGDGASVQWTPSTGSTHWNLVDEVTANDDTDYVSATTANIKDLFTFSAFSITSDDITSVKVILRVRTLTGTRTPSAILRVNGTNYLTSLGSIGVTWTTITTTWSTNPDTSLAWTEADVEGTGANPLQQIGIDSGGLGPDMRCTQCFATVDYTAAGAGVQPIELRATAVPGSRQWHPRFEFGRRFRRPRPPAELERSGVNPLQQFRRPIFRRRHNGLYLPESHGWPHLTLDRCR